jgi:hypothetical protein
MVVTRRLITLTLAVAAIALLVAFAGIMFAPIHSSGGCNHIPLVNGQPAHPCPSQP